MPHADRQAESLSPPVDAGGRRQFLTRTAAVLAAFGLAETLSQPALGAENLTKEQGAVLRKVLDAAMESGDIKAAIKKHGEGLPDSAKKVLSELTEADLKAMKAINEKLKSLEPDKVNIQDNNGYAGM